MAKPRLNMNRFLLLCFVLCLVLACSPAPREDENFLENLMKQNPAAFDSILVNRKAWEVQILYTQINRDSANRPTFKSFSFNVDSTRYFYPASTVKLPLVLLALEKLQRLRIDGLDKHATMYHDSVYSGQVSTLVDSTSETGWPSVAHYAKKILVVSDNDAYNRLYEFVGQQETNTSLKAKGFNIRILHRLERSLTPDQNRHTEQIRFVKDGKEVFKQPMLINLDSIKPIRTVFRGLGYMKRDSLINKPFDFTYKNEYPLHEQQEMLKAILFPEFAARQPFAISEIDRQFVMQYMSQLPRETHYPPYQKDSSFYDAYCKFLMFGEDKTVIPEHIRIFNKVGDAYGYLIDNAYIVDFDNNIEFMLSAVINTNTDGIYNDGKYEYKSIGYPFMKNIGQAVYQYELTRKRRVKPDLRDFQLSYKNLD